MQNRIKQIRSYYNMTQTQFGAKIGLKGNTITSYETGLRTPTDSAIISICREYNVNRQWLETGEGNMFVDTQVRTLDRIAQRYSQSRTFRVMLDVYASLSEAEQISVERYINALSDALARGDDPVTVIPTAESLQREALSSDPNATAAGE